LQVPRWPGLGANRDELIVAFFLKIGHSDARLKSHFGGGRLMMSKTVVVLVSIALVWLDPTRAAGQASQPAADAAALYARAAKIIHDTFLEKKLCSPSASDQTFDDFPPYPREWRRMEDADFAANAQARELVHQARSTEVAEWPSIDWNPAHAKNPNGLAGGGMSYLNGLRSVCNDVCDAAIYQHIQSDDSAAVESIRDVMHMADLLEYGKDRKLIFLLVANGIRACALNRLNVVTSNAALSKDPRDGHALQTPVARQLILELLHSENVDEETDENMQGERSLQAGLSPAFVASMLPAIKPVVQQAKRLLQRVNAERGLAAMSLACHLYAYQTGDWPESLEDLKDYLPAIPIDPWGDGRQTLGYALIKAGLPDGGDRPLVFSRYQSKDGLFYRTDRPEYAFYHGDGSTLPPARQKQGGQFRDVASWSPDGKHLASTTRPLP
jgi:hypothetical protein